MSMMMMMMMMMINRPGHLFPDGFSRPISTCMNAIILYDAKERL